MDLAFRIRDLTLRYHVSYFINNRPDIARLCEADGLHLGPEDMPVSEARKIVGNMMIGKSSHSMEQAQSALEEDITYLSVGPVYGTDCKKKPDAEVGTDLLNKVLSLTDTPIVAIGGITLENVAAVRQTRVNCCGMIRGIMQASHIKTAAERYIDAFETNTP